MSHLRPCLHVTLASDTFDFLAELLLCYLTGNIFGVEISCRRCADDMRTRLRAIFHWRMTYVVRTSSAQQLCIKPMLASLLSFSCSFANFFQIIGTNFPKGIKNFSITPSCPFYGESWICPWRPDNMCTLTVFLPVHNGILWLTSHCDTHWPDGDEQCVWCFLHFLIFLCLLYIGLTNTWIDSIVISL